MDHGNSLLVEQSPVDADEDAAVTHGVVGCDERVVVASEQEHVAVSEVNVCLFHFEGYGQVDVGEIAYLNLVLEVESAGGGHVGIGIILGEIAHRDAGMQCGHFMENRLRITDFQLTEKQGQMYDIFIARLLEARKPFKFKSPEFLIEAEISLTDAEKVLKLGRSGIGSEINQV